MSFELITKEKNVATVKLTIDKEAFEAGVEKAYQKNKNRFVIDGFRKGKVPRSMIERKYGKDVFYEDGLEEAFPEAYTECVKAGEFKTVASPKLISVDSIGEEGAVVTIEISLEPEFTLAEYKGIKTGPVVYKENEEDLNAEIDKLRDKNSTLVTVEDGSAADGDTCTINFEGFLGDVPFEGGKGEAYPLVLGSKTFIPGFEEQLIGRRSGDKADVKVTFPEDYQATDLAGKEAVFKVEVLKIQHKELPAVDDDFAIDLGYDDLAAMKTDLSEKLKLTKNADLKSAAEATVMNELIEKTEIDIPPMMLADKAEQLRDDNEQMLRSNGIDPETYYRYIMQSGGNDDPDQFIKFYANQAERSIKTDLIVKKIMETEKLEVTDEEFDEACAKFAASADKTPEDFKKELSDYSTDYIKYTVKVEKVYQLLIDNADKGE